MTDAARVEKHDTELTQAQLDDVAGGSMKLVNSIQRDRDNGQGMEEEIGIVFHTIRW